MLTCKLLMSNAAWCYICGDWRKHNVSQFGPVFESCPWCLLELSWSGTHFLGDCSMVNQWIESIYRRLYIACFDRRLRSLQQVCPYTFWKLRYVRAFMNSLLAQGCEAKASGDRAEVGTACHADKTRPLDLACLTDLEQIVARLSIFVAATTNNSTECWQVLAIGVMTRYDKSICANDMVDPCTWYLASWQLPLVPDPVIQALSSKMTPLDSRPSPL